MFAESWARQSPPDLRNKYIDSTKVRSAHTQINAFEKEKRMRTAPQIMIVTNGMGGGVGVTAEPALASGSETKRMV